MEVLPLNINGKTSELCRRAQSAINGALAQASDLFLIHQREITGERRTADVVRARQAAILGLSRAGLRPSRMMRAFGRDQRTIERARTAAETLSRGDAEFARRVDLIREAATLAAGHGEQA